MRVPLAENQVQRATPRVSAPGRPRVIPEAFGTPQAEAAQNIARAGANLAGALSKHLLQMQQDDQDKEVLNRETAFSKDFQNVLINPEAEEVNINGQTVSRPKGLTQRQLWQAKGVTQDLDKTYPAMREQYLKGLSPYQLKKLGPALDNHYTSYRDNLISHEARELDKDLLNSTKSNIAQRVLDASIIRQPERLGFAIDEAQGAAATYNKRFDPATQKIKNEKVAQEVIKATVISTLQNTGDLTIAQSLLDSTKDKISQSTYSDLKNKLVKGYDVMKSNVEKIELVNRINDRFNYLNLIATGKLDWQTSTDTIRNIATKDSALAEAMQKVIDSQGEYFPEETNNEAYAGLIKDVFTSGSKEEVSNFLIEALDVSANKEISRDRLAILVNAAQERAKSLPVNENDEPTALSPKQNEIDSGVKSILKTNNKQFNIGDMIVNFFKSLGSGKSPQDAHSEAVKSEINRTNPLSIKHRIGDIITNSKGESAEVVGFNESGSPIIRKKVSGKSSNIK